MKQNRLCDFRCMSAVGEECDCSCHGANHGCYNSASFTGAAGASSTGKKSAMRGVTKLKVTTNDEHQPRLF